MDVSDLIFDSAVPHSTKLAVLDLMRDYPQIQGFTQVLTPTSTNNDVNGSQHAGANIDFTYEDASMDDVLNASALGYYEYFSSYFGVYTGHYYNGDGQHFDAVVVNPPSYAAEVTV